METELTAVEEVTNTVGMSTGAKVAIVSAVVLVAAVAIAYGVTKMKSAPQPAPEIIAE